MRGILLGFLRQTGRRLGAVARRAGGWLSRHRRLPHWHEVRLFLERTGVLLPVRRRGPMPPEGPEPFQPSAPAVPYQRWVAHNRWNHRTLEAARQTLTELGRRPLLSVVMPVYNIEDCWLERAIASVQAQVYPNWELCIADDASTAPNVRPLLRRLAAADPRLKVRYLAENGNISRACNAAAAQARGEFLVFLDHDDELAPDCLLELAQAIEAYPDSDVLYSDDDKIDVAGRRYDPQLKPSWSPELLLSYMYFSHVFCVRRQLYEQVGGCRPGFEGTQDYDLALRITEHARRVTHIPRVLYHWRCLPTSTASGGEAKPEAFDRGVRAVQEALDRRGVAGRVSRPDFAVRSGLGIFQIDFPDTGPLVTILVPTHNRVDLLRRCLQSNLDKTSYQDYEIVVIDNDSTDAATLKYLDNLPGRCRVLRLTCPDGRFNYAWLNNQAVRHVDGEYVLFLNNDTEVVRPEWLSQMMGYARMPGAGAVGARLLFPDQRVQHAGIITGLYGGLAGPAFKLLPEADAGYLCYAVTARNYSAVTAACLLISRELFVEVGGFDEGRFAVAYNDVDLCLRLRERGRRSVYVPRAELLHREGSSRGSHDDPRELLAYRALWGRDRDPYYNLNLSLEHERFGIDTRHAGVRVAREHLPVRALMCTHNLNLEGAPISQLELAVGLKRRGQIAPEVYSHLDGPLARRYREAGIPVHVFPRWQWDAPLGRDALRERIAGFTDWLRGRAVDVIYGNTLSSFGAMHAARTLGLPCLWNVRESVNWRTHFARLGVHHVTPALEAFAFPYRIVFVADATRAMFQELNTQHNFSVIHNGLDRTDIEQFVARHSRADARRRIGCPPDKTVFTIIGTVCQRKGQHDFARAAIELLKRGRRDVFFYIVGCRPSPYQEALEELVRAYAEHFGLVPETDEVYHYFRASDVFVCCSTNESYPRVLLEAMAFRLPIVTTSVFGIAEQVADEVSALIYTPGDANGLAHHLLRLVGQPSERFRLAEGATAALDSLTSHEQMLAAYEQLFLEAFLTGGETLDDAISLSGMTKAA
jgi:GT2 family glycosyltransferase/glycosyltransferase involved in cell wall biosynthesis